MKNNSKKKEIGDGKRTNKKRGLGISHIRKEHRWIAYINYDGKRYHLGSYASEIEAFEARIQAGTMQKEDFIAWHEAEKQQRLDKKIMNKKEPRLKRDPLTICNIRIGISVSQQEAEMIDLKATTAGISRTKLIFLEV